MKMEVGEKFCKLVSVFGISGLLIETFLRIGEKLSASELTWPAVFRPVMSFVFAIWILSIVAEKWIWKE
jgi:hypothetical protein